MKTVEPGDKGKKQFVRRHVELIDLANEFDYSFREDLKGKIRKA